MVYQHMNCGKMTQLNFAVQQMHLLTTKMVEYGTVKKIR